MDCESYFKFPVTDGTLVAMAEAKSFSVCKLHGFKIEEPPMAFRDIKGQDLCAVSAHCSFFCAYSNGRFPRLR